MNLSRRKCQMQPPSRFELRATSWMARHRCDSDNRNATVIHSPPCRVIYLGSLISLHAAIQCQSARCKKGYIQMRHESRPPLHDSGQATCFRYPPSPQPYSAHSAAPNAAANTHVVEIPIRLPDPFLPFPRLKPPGKP